MKIIPIKSHAQREMLERVAKDPAEAKRRGLTVEQAKASLEAHAGGTMPKRKGPLRPNRHGAH